MAPLSTPDKFPTHDMFGEVIQVKVGLEPAATKTFTLHKGVASFYSGYFEAAINGGFKESQSGIIKLPSEDIDTFGLFVGWLYTRILPAQSSDEQPFSTLIKLWAFGDRRQIPLLMNACIDAIRDRTVETRLLPTRDLKWIYENTPTNSALRRLLVSMISCEGSPKVLLEKCHPAKSEWPAELWYDLLCAIWKWEPKRDGNVAKMRLCEFHLHEEGTSCATRAECDSSSD